MHGDEVLYSSDFIGLKRVPVSKRFLSSYFRKHHNFYDNNAIQFGLSLVLLK